MPMSAPFIEATRGLPPREGMVGIRLGRSETGLTCVFFPKRFQRMEELSARASSSGRTHSCSDASACAALAMAIVISFPGWGLNIATVAGFWLQHAHALHSGGYFCDC